MKRFKHFFNLSATGYGVDSKLVPMLESYLREKQLNNQSIRVLDFGCSQKPYKYVFDAFDNVVEYIGIDVYEGEMVDVVYDGDLLPFPDEYFDLVFSSSVLEHVENIDNSLSEIYRVLKRGGATIHSIPFINHVHGTPFDFHRPTYFGLLSKFNRSNFNNIEVVTTDSRYCCIINLITSQINAFLIKIAKLALNRKSLIQEKDIKQGDASPENKKSKQLKAMYFVLALNPVNFFLGLTCFFSNLLPSNDEKEMQITSAYVVRATK